MNEVVGLELLKLIHRNAKRACIPAIFAILFIGYVLSLGTSDNAWLYWVTPVSAVYLMRPVVLEWIIHAQKQTLERRLIFTGIYSFVGGSALGSIIILFPQLDLDQRLLITITLLGLSAVGSATNSGHPPFSLCFMCPLLLPLGIVWILNPGGYLDNFTAICLGSLIIMMIAIMTSLGQRTYDLFFAYINLYEKQKIMSEELSNALLRAEREQIRAEDGNRSKTRFLAAASHDLRQPVHVVSLFCAALETMVKDKNVKEVVDDMSLAINSMSIQLNELLDISRLDSGTVKPDFCHLELRGVISDIHYEFQTEATSKGLNLINEVDKGIYVRSDNTMLSQVLRNIIGNAIKYTNRGSITLFLSETDESVVLSCRDTGIGMSAKEQQHIFEEFYQIDNPERTKKKGLGLGLSIVERLARCMSCELSLNSRLGEGTCMSLSLMRSDLDKEAAQQSFREQVDTKLDTALQGWVHIVDDEPSVCKSMGFLLKELGCRVSSTSSTEETVDFLKEYRPDVVFVDLRLRGDDSGIETLNAIQTIDPGIKLVIITGETYFCLNDIWKSKGVKLLRKPVSKVHVVELLSVMSENMVLGGSHNSSKKTLISAQRNT